jgi:hypothetical protein
MIKTATREQKKELEKRFKFAGMRKFEVDNKPRFWQKYKLFIMSLHNKELTTVQYIQDGEPDIEPDKERPTVSKVIKKFIRRLTGSSNESLQELFLKELITETERQETAENLCEKYIL